MNQSNILDWQNFYVENADKAIRTVLHENEKTHLVLWQLPQNTQLSPHRHPLGTDIWLVLQAA